MDVYSISHPESWEFSQDGTSMASFTITSEQENSTDDFRENVHLLIQDISSYNLDLDGYTEITESQIPLILTDGKILKSKRHKIDGQEFHETQYSGTQDTFQLMFRTFYWLEDSKAYILTFTCISTQFDKYEQTSYQMLSSFELK